MIVNPFLKCDGLQICRDGFSFLDASNSFFHQRKSGAYARLRQYLAVIRLLSFKL